MLKREEIEADRRFMAMIWADKLTVELLLDIRDLAQAQLEKLEEIRGCVIDVETAVDNADTLKTRR